MRKNPEKRLGAGEGDAAEVKQQRFFKVKVWITVFLFTFSFVVYKFHVFFRFYKICCFKL